MNLTISGSHFHPSSLRGESWAHSDLSPQPCQLLSWQQTRLIAANILSPVVLVCIWEMLLLPITSALRPHCFYFLANWEWRLHMPRNQKYKRNSSKNRICRLCIYMFHWWQSSGNLHLAKLRNLSTAQARLWNSSWMGSYLRQPSRLQWGKGREPEAFRVADDPPGTHTLTLPGLWATGWRVQAGEDFLLTLQRTDWFLKTWPSALAGTCLVAASPSLCKEVLFGF